MEIGDVHKNVKILVDGVPWNVDDVDFVKPGKGRAIYRLKLRNLLTGATLDKTYHSGEKVDETYTTSEEEQFLYKENDNFIFMNSKTYEQHPIPEALLGDKKNYLKEGTTVIVQMMGDRPIDVTLPVAVELKVVESGFANRADTISPQSKPVTLETGFTVGVPAFIKEGDTIKIDTRTGQYLERVATKK